MIEDIEFGPKDNSTFVQVLAYLAIAGCVVFFACVVIADIIVPDHDWIADTISDLGAGKYEFIADMGIYAFSTSLIACALMASHLHFGSTRWSIGIVGLASLAQIIFLVGARNEYGDNDNEGVVIHYYLVYAMGALMTITPWALAEGAATVAHKFRYILLGIAALWAVSAPIFFILPTKWDGIYERYLGLIAFALVLTLSWLFIVCVRCGAANKS
ncbi:DUF998 domain-containing protein [Yoonia sp. 208BN28-4]|uniref:DUF998 domain-containing protein n=1 Tax=Yoonia sp. 208BN28-4 TaxID=3126505 RepID=UPI0030B1E921